MTCPKCGGMLSIFMKEDDELNSGVWYGRMECRKCLIYVRAYGSSLDDVCDKVDYALKKGRWFSMRRLQVIDN